MDTTPNPARWWALAALVMSTLAVGLDATVLSVALPTLATDLHASTSQLQWFVDSYNLVLAAVLLPVGLLGDRFGHKRFLLGALVLFGVASALCAYSGSAEVLITGRVLLALGAAALMTLPAAILPRLFGEAERSRALTAWMTAMFASFPLGPIVGGLLLDHFWWGSVFLINVPVVVVAVTAVASLVPESRSPQPVRLDVGGLTLFAGALLALTFGLIEGGERGWSDGVVLAALVGFPLLLAGFALRQRVQLRRLVAGQSPLIDLSIFRLPGFAWGTALGVISTFAMFGMLFATPQYFQNVLGHDALGTGVRLLPMIGGLLVGGRLGRTLAERFGAKIVAAKGFSLMAVAMVIAATTDLDDGYGLAATWLAVFGLGLGFGLPTAMDAALGGIPKDRSGLGSGLLMSLRNVGGAIGVAVLGAVLNAGYRGAVDGDLARLGLDGPARAAVQDGPATGLAVARATGSPELVDAVRSAFVHGSDAMYLVCAAVALLGAVIAVALLPARTTTPEATPAETESAHDVVPA
ncbi:MFS transporter [Spongisporangium articulatum]|uniref:MFS transporter n=1 Tax=Spongisporangium articulatum TaxID=3362603 RepID=A0ABW8AHN3_9ACTN